MYFERLRVYHVFVNKYREVIRLNLKNELDRMQSKAGQTIELVKRAKASQQDISKLAVTGKLLADVVTEHTTAIREAHKAYHDYKDVREAVETQLRKSLDNREPDYDSLKRFSSIDDNLYRECTDK